MILSILSPVQNLTFEDIHAVRTYEKAWVLWVTASQNCPKSDGFINIVDCMLLFALHPPPYVKASCKLHKFCKFFLYEYISVMMDGSSLQPCAEIQNKKGKKKNLLFASCLMQWYGVKLNSWTESKRQAKGKHNVHKIIDYQIKTGSD